jgi:hypothetical protein
MANNFREAYAALTDFIAHHSEIEIAESVTSIPGEVRPEFYDLFNAARNAFLEEKFPAYVSDALLLSEQYRTAEESAAKLLAFEEPMMASDVFRFLRDPKETLTRELFNTLFDLLKGRESIDSFEAKAGFQIERLFPFVFRGGYEKWVVLSFVLLLEADKTLRVDARSLAPGERAKLYRQAPMEDVPLPAESASFLFSRAPNVIFAVPDIIVHSSRLNRFISIRSEFSDGIYSAWNPSQKREWHLIDPDMLRLLESGLTLVYAAEEAEDIALVADAANLCRPDLILWCVDTGSLSREEAMERMTQANNLFRPTNGIYIIANHPWPEPPAPPESAEPSETLQQEPDTDQAQVAAIRILNVGYDQSTLLPVAEAFAVPEDATSTA